MRCSGFGWVVFAIIIAMACPVQAEEQKDNTSDQVVMSEVVVTASREEESVETVPADVSVIDAMDIEQSNAQNVPELLQSLAGVHISDISGNQRNYTVDLRGFGESSQQNILLLVDGRRVNLQDLSGPDWNSIPVERIERIEVIRGSRGSVVYGDNATAGVINIITKQGAGTNSSATQSAGSYGTSKSTMSANTAVGITAIDITGGLATSDGYRDNSDSKAMDLGVNLRVDPSTATRFNLSTGYHFDNTRNPGGLLEDDFQAGADRTDTTHPTDFDRVQDQYVKAGLEMDMLSDDTFKIEAALRNRDKRSHGSFAGGYSFEADTDSDIITASTQMIFREDFEGVANKVILGIDFTDGEQSYDSDSFNGGVPSGSIQTTLRKINGAWYIQDNLSAGDHLALSMGYRSDRAIFKYEDTPVSKRIFDEGAYDFGINYLFRKNTHAYIAYNHGFRYPVMDEQFNYFYSSVNTTVNPQVSDNYEAGFTWEAVPRLTFFNNYFLVQTDDEIFFNPDLAVYDNDNMEGTTTRQGLVIGFNWFGDHLQAGLSYTYTETEMGDGPYKGKEVPNVPNYKATGNLSYRWADGLFLGLDAIYVGERYLISDLYNAYDKAEDYTVVNAKIKFDWQQFLLFVNLNNLFNTSYSAYEGLSYNASYVEMPGRYPSPEFNFLVGFTVRYGE